jgi:sec-independent protein translocase protein TatC
VGLVTPELLAKYRRHALVLIVVAAALLTPGGDPLSTLALAVPLYVLFELSVIVARLVVRRRPPDESIAILLAPLLLLRRRSLSHTG